MKNLLKRPRHNRPHNNRVNRNYHPHQQHSHNRQHDDVIDEHLHEDKRLDYRPARNRVTLQQYVDKFTVQARDAASSGDRVLSENYLQHADHFTRLLNEQKIVRQQIEQKMEQKKQHAERAQVNEHQHTVEKNDANKQDPIIIAPDVVISSPVAEETVVVKNDEQENELLKKEEKPKKRIVRKKPSKPSDVVPEAV